MAEDSKDAGKGMDRRKFLLLAGGAAALGGFLVATKGKGLSNLLKTPQTAQPQITQGRYVKAPATGQLTEMSPLTSFLSKLLGGKL